MLLYKEAPDGIQLRTPHLSPSGEPAAISQHHKASGIPGAMSKELPERSLAFTHPYSQHVIMEK